MLPPPDGRAASTSRFNQHPKPEMDYLPVALQHKTQLTVAEVSPPEPRAGTYIIFNQVDSLHICEFGRTDQARPPGLLNPKPWAVRCYCLLSFGNLPR